jgi:hypothetical protein
VDGDLGGAQGNGDVDDLIGIIHIDHQ